MWTRIIVAATVGLASLVVPAPAMAAAPPSAPLVAGLEQSCDQVLQQAQRVVSATGKAGTVPCMRRTASPAAGPVASAAAAQGGCSSSWAYTRLSACLTGANYTLDVFTVTENGGRVLIGQMNHSVTINVGTSGASSRWNSSITISIGYSWGAVAGTSIYGSAECGANCSLVGYGFVGGPVTGGIQVGGDAQFGTSSYGLGTIWRAWSTWRWWFSNPAWIPPVSNSQTISSPAHRCDEAIGTAGSIGCVFDNVRPIHEISSTRWPKYARHVQLAINFGLPSVLTRTQVGAQNDANRAVACPSSQQPANGWSCDEYPYASTQEGAANPMHPYGRTFQILNWNSGYPPFYCGIGWLTPRRTGESLGYSVCGIPLEENRGGGVDLGVFYYANRVLHDDKFVVRVV